MRETNAAEHAETAARLQAAAENIVRICETELRDASGAVSAGWRSGAARLFASRMEELRQTVIQEAGNLLNRSSL
jgi:hypothetical protein